MTAEPNDAKPMTTEIQKLENLVEVAAVLSQQNEYEEILRVVAQKVAGLLNAETAVIMMINPQTRQTVKTIFNLKKFAAQQQKQAESFHEEILDFMQQRHWPGNIRELVNWVERLVTLAPAEMARLDHNILPPDLRKELKKLEKRQPVDEITKSLHESLAEYEEQLIRQALAANHGNQSKTARLLKISEHTLRYKMRKMGIMKRKRGA